MPRAAELGWSGDRRPERGPALRLPCPALPYRALETVAVTQVLLASIGSKTWRPGRVGSTQPQLGRCRGGIEHSHEMLSGSAKSRKGGKQPFSFSKMTGLASVYVVPLAAESRTRGPCSRTIKLCRVWIPVEAPCPVVRG